MISMRKRHLLDIAVPALAMLGLVAAGAVAPLGAATGSDEESAAQAMQPGETSESPGCVGCHDGDMAATLGVLLDELGHMPVDDMIETVPGDCLECHNEDGGAWMMSEMSHVLHYEDPANNAFVIDQGGSCLSCHAMDVESGEVAVKSGPKNW